MVQVIQTPQDLREGAFEKFTEALGGTIGNKLSNYFMNKSLDNVLSDKSLQNAPISEQMSRIEQEMRPYGPKGLQAFQNRLTIAQQRQNEKQQQTDRKKADVLRRRFAGEDLSNEEKGMFTPEEEFKIEQMKQTLKLQEMKNEGKASPGGFRAQPVKKETLDKIENVLNENPKATDDELLFKLQKEGVDPTTAGDYVENRRRRMERESVAGTKEKQAILDTDIKIHNESKAYEEAIRKEAKSANKQLEIIEPILKDVKSGKISPSSTANIFRHFGDKGKAISDALLSKEEARMQAAVPEFLEGRKELFGVRLSDADLKLLQDKLPDIGKNKEANEQILNLMQKYAERSKLKDKASRDVLEKYGVPYREGKLRPLNYENLVEQEYDRLVEKEGLFDELPDPTKYKGKRIFDEDRGIYFRSTGTAWVTE